MTTDLKYPVSATITSLEIIEALKDLETAGVTELAQHVGIAKSAAHKHLTTLESRGYIQKEGQEYRLGLQFLALGGFLRNNMDLYHGARPEIRDLAEKTGERVNLMVEEDGLGVYLMQEKGDESIHLTTDTYVGKHVYLHNTSLGKSILAFTPDDQVNDILDQHGLPPTSAKTITEVEEFKTEIELTRERGYALDDEERLPGLRCVGVPVTNTDGKAIAAISLSAPVSRMGDNRFHEEAPSLLQDTANIIELNVSY